MGKACVSCDMLVKKGGYDGMKRLTTGREIREQTETGQVNRGWMSTGLTRARRECIFVLVEIC